MIISETNPGPARVIALKGGVDDDSAAQVRRRLEEILSRAGRKARLILDLGEADRLSAQGIRMILFLAREVNRLDGRLVVCGLSPNAADMFEASRLSDLVPICPDRKAALREF